MFENFDEQVSTFTEGVARSLSRRRVLVTSAKVAAVTVAGATLGIFVNIKDAFASTCTCHWYGGSGNANCPSHPGCNGINGVCPSGCSICVCAVWQNNNCVQEGCVIPGYGCNYPNGSWVSCTGQGTCGNGQRVCVDCKCPNCSYVCTCLSSCVCCNCCTPQQVEDEMRRLRAMGITAPIQA
jgi:hypothetical protein